MDLLPWFRRIPGHEINVRIPSAPNTPKVTIDTVETDVIEDQPMTFTWGSTRGSDWDFDMSFDVNQGIPEDLTWDMPTRKEDRVKVPWVPESRSSNSSGELPLALTWKRDLTKFAMEKAYWALEGQGSEKMMEEQAKWESVALRVGLKLAFPNMIFMDAKPPGT